MISGKGIVLWWIENPYLCDGKLALGFQTFSVLRSSLPCPPIPHRVLQTLYDNSFSLFSWLLPLSYSLSTSFSRFSHAYLRYCNDSLICLLCFILLNFHRVQGFLCISLPLVKHLQCLFISDTLPLSTWDPHLPLQLHPSGGIILPAEGDGWGPQTCLPQTISSDETPFPRSKFPKLFPLLEEKRHSHGVQL